ncbi:TFIIH basal transcription factor complex, subunit SSL1 [Metschnikowia bicuspidata var. bicuspidata NRRL YB-4993]|uniref:General transcription and DNA repair factor IIH n=1 Tax=Metschnikowia bicuspidata var. bicuspidata NRRL YB-4993 TaxID=869754 RepID=A0A1A0HA99_9ASCO|nr:TFIIH basal transcription factor complex, subunit SSL1 [Metschnikowia bicuspidata var. bicuspidata NRRL YB-4993]OBA20802.1 TFIIH basal transcription factor complex, subunit SSL1 [Metschnikowia bicuspidata var. bicuspidata NRRL YB-4993]
MARRTRLKAPTSTLKSASGAYAWEDQYQRPWDLVAADGDAGASLELLVQQAIERRRNKILKHPSAPFQRGILRTLVVVVDGLRAMLDKDLRPTRLACTLALLQDFVREFFDQNPVAQMAVVWMRNGVASVVLALSGLPQQHIDRLRAVRARQHNRYEPQGDPLLQNALELARLLLVLALGAAPGVAPPAQKASREILVVFGALFTLDPGDIHGTITALAREHIRAKVIGLLAQVAVCQELVRRTNLPHAGRPGLRADARLARFYGVIINEHHFRELLMDCVEPLAVPRGAGPAVPGDALGVPVIRMGFPLRLPAPALPAANLPRLCACHPTRGSAALREPVPVQPVPPPGTSAAVPDPPAAYTCPQCRSRVCSVPTVCPACGLMLILSTHLARLYHHLVPLAAYTTVAAAPAYPSSHCYGCLLEFPPGSPEAPGPAASSLRFRCGKCAHDFCIDCDVFVHEVLHNCPGCENRA